jgi:hypothetical protein
MQTPAEVSASPAVSKGREGQGAGGRHLALATLASCAGEGEGRSDAGTYGLYPVAVARATAPSCPGIHTSRRSS